MTAKQKAEILRCQKLPSNCPSVARPQRHRLIIDSQRATQAHQEEGVHD